MSASHTWDCLSLPGRRRTWLHVFPQLESGLHAQSHLHGEKETRWAGQKMWRYSIQNFTFLEGMYISASSNKKLDFAFLVSPWIWRRWEQGLGRVSQLTWGGCLFWGRQSYITRALWHGRMLPNHAFPLTPPLLHPSLPSFISQALWDSVFCLSLLAGFTQHLCLGLPWSCFLFPSSNAVRVLRESQATKHCPRTCIFI